MISLPCSFYGSIVDEEEAEQEEERSYGSYMMERLTGNIEGRVDHMLQVCSFIHTNTLYSFGWLALHANCNNPKSSSCSLLIFVSNDANDAHQN